MRLSQFAPIRYWSSRLLIRFRVLLRNKRSTRLCWRIASVSTVLLTETLHASAGSDQGGEIVELIADEVAVVDAYLTAWRGTGTAEAPAPAHVETSLRSDAARRVLAWPTIRKEPVSETADGRLVKAHPLTFPMGCGDFRQSRLRNGFSAFEWTQHVFRHVDGRVLASMRGQRAIWACFNTALRDAAYRTGGLVHKQSGEHIITKAELQSLVAGRKDLVHTVSSFGSDLPSTPMRWKR